MLVVSRKTQEAVQLGEEIRVVVLELRSDQVKLGIEAPASVRIVRQELLEEVRESNKGGLGLAPEALRSLSAALKPVPVRWSVVDGQLHLELSQSLPPGTYTFQG